MKRLVNVILNKMGYRISKDNPRGMLSYLKSIEKRNLIGAEIGVFEGGHAVSLFRNLNIKRMYLVDGYVYYTNDHSGSYGKLGDAELIMLKRLNRYFDNGQAKFIRLNSDKAITKLPDNLDFVYIDANHSYDSAKEDIKNYWNKVKIGGVLAGHDIENLNYKENGVTKAVIEFVAKNNLNIIIGNKDWIIIKEKR